MSTSPNLLIDHIASNQASKEVTAMEPLLPQHQQLIAASGIEPAVAAERGYRSLTSRADRAVFKATQHPCRASSERASMPAAVVDG